jgi:hypothetical protein
MSSSAVSLLEFVGMGLGKGVYQAGSDHFSNRYRYRYRIAIAIAIAPAIAIAFRLCSEEVFNSGCRFGGPKVMQTKVNAIRGI